MLFDVFTFDLAFFFSLISILIRLPAESQYQSWNGPTFDYRGNYRVQRPWPTANDPVATYGSVEEDERRDQRGQAPRGQSGFYQGFSSYPPSILFVTGPNLRVDQFISRRDSPEEFAGVENEGGRNWGNTYSSHVNQRGRAVTPREAEERAEGAPGLEGPGDQRQGSAREVVRPVQRIVTSKGGTRKSPQGSSVKTQNKPCNPVVTNGIPTTEKSFKEPIQKVLKRQRPRPVGANIVFPDGYKRKLTPKENKCVQKSELTFCEDVGEEYPSHLISGILEKDGSMFKEFFGQDMLREPNITERINAPEEDSLCPSRQQVIFPKAAQNMDNKWLFIVNQDNYLQGVTVEICLNPGNDCALMEGFPLGYSPYCKQKYIGRRMVAIEENGTLFTDSFWLPSCCSCVFNQANSPRMRLLNSSGKRKPSTNS